jgi:hypothetical protein
MFLPVPLLAWAELKFGLFKKLAKLECIQYFQPITSNAPKITTFHEFFLSELKTNGSALYHDLYILSVRIPSE